jgi:hypothetical protein
MQVECYQFLMMPISLRWSPISGHSPGSRCRCLFNKVEYKDVEQGIMGDAQAQIPGFVTPAGRHGSTHAWDATW